MKAKQAPTLSHIGQQLQASIPKELVDDLLNSYENLRKYYFLKDYISAGVRAGRFSETGMRILQHIAFQSYTPLTSQLNSFPAEVKRLADVQASLLNESIRLLIPKTLQVVYDLRNKRDLGHVGGDVDNNFVDATLALTCCSWVIAELLRMYYTANIEESQELVDSIVQVKIPLIQEFSGDLKILKGNLPVSSKILVLLFYRRNSGLTFDKLVDSIGKKHIKNIRTTLCNLDDDGYIYKDKKSKYFITIKGENYVSEKTSFEI